MTARGQVVVLNGAPRSGKSSIAAAMQERLAGVWMNIGVDIHQRMTPDRARPGIGLRPGESGHSVAPLVPLLYSALYESVAVHSGLGLNVVVDVGHYDIGILADAARRLEGHPVLFVGVLCPIDVIMERRRATDAGAYVVADADEPIPEPVRQWQIEVHAHWSYDLELDTSRRSPEECADLIAERLNAGSLPQAFAQLRP